jgi:hypothetical protein
VRLVLVRRRDADLRVEGADAEHAGVGADRAEGLDGNRSNRHLLVLQQPAADEHDFGPRVGRQRCRDRRGVRDDDAVPGGRKAARDLERRGPAVDDERPSRRDQRDGRLCQRDLLLVGDLEPALERQRLRGRGERPAVHSVQQSARGELLQVTTDRVL